MNTNPDEAKLALWLEDELTGSELAAFEPWALAQPEQVQAREQIRQWRAMMASTIPASEEPPYPDFFNSRVAQAIREPAPKVALPAKPGVSFWRSWFLPATAFAGMAMTFWLGTKTRSAPEYVVEGAPRAIPVEQLVYTPENGVKADIFRINQESGTVIVLNGVRAIPDSLDFTAGILNEGDLKSTAENAPDADSLVTP